MSSALALLLRLRIRAWLRRMIRNAASPRGVLALAFGLLFFALIVGKNFALRISATEPVFKGEGLEQLRRNSPLLLLVYCLVTVLLSSGEEAISFSPAEVQFLFPAPFTRRQLLAYKLLGTALLCVVYGLLMTGFFLAYVPNPLAAWLGLVLTLWFVQFFSTTVALVLQTLGARATTRSRKIILVGLAVMLTLTVGWLGRDALAEGPARALDRLTAQPAVWYGLAPLRWFVEATTAEQLWPEFADRALRCLAIDAGLLLVVFLLDARYLEAAATASDREYERLQRVRSGGALAGAGSNGKARFSLPALPDLGGVGILVWRQLTTAARSLRPLLILLGCFIVILVGPRLAIAGDDAEMVQTGLGLTIGVLTMSFGILTTMLTFDFRGDVDRIEVLKTLPISPYRIVIGQLLGPALLLSAVQVLLTLLGQIVWGSVAELLIVVVLFALPLNFLSFGLDNLLFLWFPERFAPSGPGDFQMMGRQMIKLVAKFVALSLLLVPISIAALAAFALGYHFFGDGIPAVVVVSWLGVTAAAAVVVLPVAAAFRRFDVARDTPP